MPDQAKPTPTRSDRGLAYYPEIKTRHGHTVSVYESSSADAPHLWLNVALTRSGASEARTNREPEEATALLSIEDAEKLIVTLRATIDGHYHHSDA